jgi:hypothetical protein
MLVDRFKDCMLLFRRKMQIPSQLKIHPEISRHSRKLSLPQGLLGVMPRRPLIISCTKVKLIPDFLVQKEQHPMSISPFLKPI